MFSKRNSKLLNLINVLYLAQLVICAIFVLQNIAMLIFPSETNNTSTLTAMSSATICLMLAVAFMVITNRSLPKRFAPTKTRAEKFFVFFALIIIDTCICGIAVNLSELAFTTSTRIEYLVEPLANFGCLFLIFLLLLIFIPRLRIFRADFSTVLNLVNLVALLSLGWNLAWFGSAVIKGPEDCDRYYSSSSSYYRSTYYEECQRNAQAEFSRSMFLFTMATIVLSITLLALVKNGYKLSGSSKEADGQKILNWRSRNSKAIASTSDSSSAGGPDSSRDQSLASAKNSSSSESADLTIIMQELHSLRDDIAKLRRDLNAKEPSRASDNDNDGDSESSDISEKLDHDSFASD